MSGKASERIHFIRDGFTGMGKVWMRGEEFDPSTVATNDAGRLDEESWWQLSESDQMERYGRVFFRPGPFPEDDRIDPAQDALRERVESWVAVMEIENPTERKAAEKAYRRQYGEPPGPHMTRAAMLGSATG